MRIFWRTLAVLGGIVVLLLIAVAVAIHSVDVKEFIGPLQQRVKEATGRDLVVRGGIDLKLGLEPKLVIDDVALSNASWAKQPQMVSAKQIEAQIALLPLLHKRFEIVRFKLVSPSIDLETDPSGNGNWEFPALAAAGRPGSPAPSGASGGTLGTLAIGDLAISDGALTYRDGRSGQTTTVVIEELAVHARDAQSPISGRFRGRINDTPVALEGDFGPLEQLTGRRWPYPVTVQGNIDEKRSTVSTKVSVQNNAITLDQMQVGYGTTQLTGQMTVTTGGARPVIAFKLAAPTLTLGELAATAVANANAAKAAAARSHYVFSEQPIDVTALHAVDATGDLAIDKLVLPDGQHVDQVRVQLSLQNGRLDIPVLQGSAFGGSVQGRALLDASRSSDAALAVHVDAKGLQLGAILAAQGVKRDVRGGKTDVKIDLNSHGASERQWAANATGNVVAVVGQASLANSKASADVAVERLAEAVNPFRNVDASTELQCAVVRLPLRNGVATIDRSIAVETNRVAASASGTLDFRTETIDLSIKPQIRQGVSIDLTQVAQLVRFQGPFIAPTVGVDAAATAATVAKIGAAVSTGGVGLAALGGSFLVHPGDTAAPCRAALGEGTPGAAATASATTAKQTSAPAEDIGKAIGKLFGR
jgi:uncharacterized protein involved in outer membrane biogenesis